MSKSITKRVVAERLYIENGWTAKQVAESVGVTENTIGSWVKKGDWKNKRNEILASPLKIKSILLDELQKVVSGEKPNFNADDLAKITRALERIDKGVNVQVIISSMKLFTDWLTDQKLTDEELELILSLSKDFIRYRINHE